MWSGPAIFGLTAIASLIIGDSSAVAVAGQAAVAASLGVLVGSRLPAARASTRPALIVAGAAAALILATTLRLWLSQEAPRSAAELESVQPTAVAFSDPEQVENQPDSFIRVTAEATEFMLDRYLLALDQIRDAEAGLDQ